MTKIFKIPFATQGDRTAVPDDVQADGSLSYTQGYGYDYERDQATDPAAKDIEREKMNSIFHDITGAVGEIQAFGMPVWAEEGKPYAIRSVVYHNKKAWQSKIENNNTEPAVGVAWTELKADVTAEDVGAYTKVEANLKFQPVGNYADKNEVNGKMAKDKNGADIPDTEAFINNLGLGEAAKSGISQTTGTSKTDVMSQKSVTDELNKKFDKTGGEITGDIILNDGTAKQDVKIRAWGAADRETVFEIDFGDEYALHVSKYKDRPVSAVFKGTVTPGDYSNFDSRYVGKSTFEQAISSLPKNTALKANNGWFKDGATGLIIQWGKVTDTGEGKSWLDFPIPFPNACVNIQVTVNAVGVPSNNYSTVYRIELNGAEIGRDQNGSWWVAIGW
ncbi:gp53-like domain-containing protein [Morganella morganii]|uniref:gp53-like domain-containing protein n=1 Tax=Morganella morganii TaxID=582 RepID=UPI003CFBB734